MKTFTEFINEAESEDQFEVSKYIASIAKMVNPNDKKNHINITVTQKKGETTSFIIAYDTLDNKTLSQNEVNDLWDNDRETSDKLERHQINIKKMAKGWKVDTKIPAKGDLAQYSGKLTSDEVLDIVKDLESR